MNVKEKLGQIFQPKVKGEPAERKPPIGSEAMSKAREPLTDSEPRQSWGMKDLPDLKASPLTDYELFMNGFLADLRSLLLSKSHYYTGGLDKPLKTYRAAAEASNTTVAQAIFTRMAEKWERLKNMFKREEHTKEEIEDSFLDCLHDICGTALLFAYHLEEEKK